MARTLIINIYFVRKGRVTEYEEGPWGRNCPRDNVQIGHCLFILVLFADAAIGAAARQEHPYRNHWKRSVVGKVALGRVFGGAALGQAMHRPSKYGTAAAGFGKRVGAGFAINVVGRTVEHLVAAKLHEDLHYHRSQKHGIGPRLEYALKSTFVTRNTRTGKATPAAGRLAGHAAAGAVTQAVLAAGSGAATAGIGLAASAGANIIREFVPRRKRPNDNQ
jgi:hypothetical protein